MVVTFKKIFQTFILQVNNAGTAAKGPLMESKIEDLDLMLNLFVRAVFTITQRAVPTFIENKGKKIIPLLIPFCNILCDLKTLMNVK